jgi:hypothetical protein
MKILTEEVLRMAFLSNYDKSKTLSENREIIFEQDTTGANVGEIERELNKLDSDEQKIVNIIISNYKDMSSFQNFLNTYKTNTGKDFSIDAARALSPSQDKTEWDNLKKHLATFGITLELSPFKSGVKSSLLFSGLTPPEPIPTTDPWTNYQCVVNHPNAKKTKDTSGGIVYLINGVYYYGNGRKRLKNGTMAPYTCKSPEFITKKQAPEIPKDLDGVEGVKAFQNWLDDNHGDDNKGQGKGWATGLPDGKLSQAGGYGRFGPRTSAAWKLYKTEYLNRGNSKNVVDDNTGNPYGEDDTDEVETTTPVNTNEPPQQ